MNIKILCVVALCLLSSLALATYEVNDDTATLSNVTIKQVKLGETDHISWTNAQGFEVFSLLVEAGEVTSCFGSLEPGLQRFDILYAPASSTHYMVTGGFAITNHDVYKMLVAQANMAVALNRKVDFKIKVGGGCWIQNLRMK